jgi:hypothetical protein
MNMLIELLRKNIETCGKRRSVISRETGIDEAALSRIVYGGSCKAETCDILLKYFGYEVRKKKGGKRK